jgi:hypothetical protein
MAIKKWFENNHIQSARALQRPWHRLWPVTVNIMLQIYNEWRFVMAQVFMKNSKACWILLHIALW